MTLSHKPFPGALTTLLTAVSCGIICGFVEGLALLFFHINPRMPSWDTLDVLRIAVFADVFWFVLAACLVIPLRRFIGFPDERTTFVLFVFLTIFDWLSLLLWRIHTYALVLGGAGIAISLSRWVLNQKWHSVRLRNGLFWTTGVAALAISVIPAVPVFQKTHQGSLGNSVASQGGTKPNVLFIIIDTLRADHLSAYGYSRLTSPNLDRLAKEGVLFENAIATSSWSLPSHTSLLTGRFPSEHKAESIYGTFDGRYPLISEFLKGIGYRTGAFSANSMYFTPIVGLGRGFDAFEFHSKAVLEKAGRTFYAQEAFALFGRLRITNYEPGRWRAKDMLPTILSWIDLDQRAPFFAVVNFFDVHEPYNPPDPFRSKFTTLKAPAPMPDVAVPKNSLQRLLGDVDLYDGAFAYEDAQIGALLEQLNKRSILDRTLIVVTADHGQSFGERGLYGHGRGLYRELIHVPLIIRWPNHIPSGIRVSQPITTAAIPATIAVLSSSGNGQPFSVKSLDKMWSDGNASMVAPYPLAELAKLAPTDDLWNPATFGSSRSLMSDTWHYLVHQKFGVELYDWHRDPTEIKNLAATREGKVMVQQFDKYLAGLVSKDN